MIGSGNEKAAPDSGGGPDASGPLPGKVCEQFIQRGKPHCRRLTYTRWLRVQMRRSARLRAGRRA